MIPSGFASIWTNTIGFGKRKRRRRASVHEMVKKQEALWTEYEGPADRRLSAGPFLSCFGLLIWKYDDLPIRRRTSRCPRISSRVLPGHHAPWYLLCSDGHLRLCSWGCRGGIMAYRSFLEQSTMKYLHTSNQALQGHFSPSHCLCNDDLWHSDCTDGTSPGILAP